MSSRMIGRATLAALLVCALAFGVTSPSPADGRQPIPEARDTPGVGTFSSLSYNVAGLPEILSGSSPAVNTALISPLLNAYDVVLVQEDWANPDPPLPGVEVYHEILISQVTHPHLSTPAPVPLGNNPLRPTALVSDGLNRMSRFPFTEVERHMWPSCFGGIDTSDGGAGDCLSEKGFSVARTSVAPGVEIDIYNLHAEAGRTALDNAAHAEDFEVLADHINLHSGDRAVIVGGDYNLHTDREFDAGVFDTFLEETGLNDPCDEVDCGDDRHVIDKFTYRNHPRLSLEPLNYRFERDVFQDDQGGPLSDHDALAVDWEWTVHPTFADVPYGQEFFEEIEEAAEAGIVGGFADGTFRPTLPVSRGQMAALLSRYDEGIARATCGAAPFPDVPADHPFCAEIEWLVDQGIAGGFADGTFRPGNPVTRQTAAAMLAPYLGIDAPVCTETPFVDVPATQLFCPEITALLDAEVIAGYPDDTFRPSEVVSRQVATALVVRLPAT